MAELTSIDTSTRRFMKGSKRGYGKGGKMGGKKGFIAGPSIITGKKGMK